MPFQEGSLVTCVTTREELKWFITVTRTPNMDYVLSYNSVSFYSAEPVIKGQNSQRTARHFKTTLVAMRAAFNLVYQIKVSMTHASIHAAHVRPM